MSLETPRATSRTRNVTWHDPIAAAAAAAGMTGRERIEATAAGRLPPPPMASVMGLRIVSIGDGEIVVACRPEEMFYNPLGVAHGGFLCTLLDTAMGLAVMTQLPPGAGSMTIEMKVNFFKAVREGDGEVSVTGRVTRRGSRVTFADAEARNAAGTAVGNATSSLLLVTRSQRSMDGAM